MRMLAGWRRWRQDRVDRRWRGPVRWCVYAETAGRVRRQGYELEFAETTGLDRWDVECLADQVAGAGEALVPLLGADPGAAAYDAAAGVLAEVLAGADDLVVAEAARRVADAVVIRIVPDEWACDEARTRVAAVAFAAAEGAEGGEPR